MVETRSVKSGFVGTVVVVVVAIAMLCLVWFYRFGHDN